MSRFRLLLSPGTFGAIGVPNRVVMAPMTRCRAFPDGAVPLLYATHFAQRASAGLLITDGTMVSPQGVGYPYTPGIWTDEHVEAWKPVTRAVHAAGGRIALQLMHVGRVSLASYQPDGAAPVSSSPTRAAKTMLYSPRWVAEDAAEPRALDINEMAGVVAQFGTAARRAKAAGFDAVEIHAADGYLIDQFLRDGVNQRHDRYGGSPENRARLLLEIAEAVAKEIGADRTGVRLSPLNPFNDMADRDPLTTFGATVKHLAALQLAWTQLAGVADTDLLPRLRDVYGAPFMLNGGFSAESADAAITNELAMAVSFGTFFIANPDLVERFASGAELSTADPTTYYGGAEKGYTDYPALAPG